MATETTSNSRQQQVLVGDLPQDFLRVSSAGQAPGFVYPQQQVAATFASSNLNRLVITIVQAKLTKNYGLTKMDPYCRLRLGHTILETPTAHSGAKNPRWNKVIQCYVPHGLDSLYVEIFDELFNQFNWENLWFRPAQTSLFETVESANRKQRAFTMDDRIAWAHIALPAAVFTGKTVDDWYALNGEQGDGKEGMLNLVTSYNPVPVAPVMQPLVYSTGVTMMPAMPVYYPPQVGGVPLTVAPPLAAPGPQFSDEDVAVIKDMFPDTDVAVIRSLLEANHGDRDRTVNNLLSMAA